jgi:16S rRNA (cytidine1402-2'-O)-methyltransferase
MVQGRIYLIPVTLGGKDFRDVIPDHVISLTLEIRYFIVENIRSARRYLRLIDNTFPIDESVFYELNEHTKDSDLGTFFEPLNNGKNIGLMSEAGLPGIADPGKNMIYEAHKRGFEIVPLSGPSSIVLALISSGLNGQNFAFNGYLPVKNPEMHTKLKEIESRSRTGEAHIFMETPYRTQKMLDSILSVCYPDTKLCIASDITLPGQSIKTKTISEWKNKIPDIRDKLVMFILQAG